MILTLIRDQHPTDARCTLGVLSAADHIFQTVERPWVPGPAGSVCGAQGKSCIAPGTYVLKPRYTDVKGKHWILSNSALAVYQYEADIPVGVYARCLVLIHSANWAHELLGCIAPGIDRALMDGEWGVTKSHMAMDALRALLNGVDDLQLEIT